MKILFVIFGIALSGALMSVTQPNRSRNDCAASQDGATAVQKDTITVYRNSTANLRSRFIPTQVFSMKNLRVLSIQGMDCDSGDTTSCWMIRDIPSEIKALKKLETLQLSVNAIGVVPVEITQLKELKTLDLTDNPGLTDINSITSLAKLEELYLFGCNLDKLPEDIVKLRKLRRLGLTGNRLDKAEVARIRQALPRCEVIFEN